MSNYHTQALLKADIFTVMGSIYAEVARYDSAISVQAIEQAAQAASRAEEIIDFAGSLKQINNAQKQEIKALKSVFSKRVKKNYKSDLDDYFMPFAIAARLNR